MLWMHQQPFDHCRAVEKRLHDRHRNEGYHLPRLKVDDPYIIPLLVSTPSSIIKIRNHLVNGKVPGTVIQIEVANRAMSASTCCAVDPTVHDRPSLPKTLAQTSLHVNMNRIIIHIDMNSYFASVEQQANPFLRGKPIGVTGKSQERSVITTASIEAKRLGVKTAMSTWEAKKILPSLILISGDPEKYSEITHRFNAIYRDFTPRLQYFSVDETFLDVTEEAEDYLGATMMAQAIRQRLYDECGERITASIGIGPNRLMAKLASESVKPNGLTVALPHQVLDLLDHSELRDLCGIGPRIEHRLHDMGLKTFTQIRECDPKRLEEEFKSYGRWLHEAAWGRESDAVIAAVDKFGIVARMSPLLPRSGIPLRGTRGTTGGYDDDPKSVGHSYTLPADVTDVRIAKRYLLGLCDKVAWRLRRDGLRARCVHAYVRYGDFSGEHQSKRFKEAKNDGLELYKICWEMMRSWDGVRDIIERVEHAKPIRFVGLSTSQLTRGPQQIPLFKKERNIISALSSLDKIQTRYGSKAWSRASLIPIEFKNRSSGFHFDHEM